LNNFEIGHLEGRGGWDVNVKIDLIDITYLNLNTIKLFALTSLGVGSNSKEVRIQILI